MPELSVAACARVRKHVQVNAPVSVQVLVVSETRATVRAFVRLFSCKIEPWF